jgi:hypothetical protein
MGEYIYFANDQQLCSVICEAIMSVRIELIIDLERKADINLYRHESQAHDHGRNSI